MKSRSNDGVVTFSIKLCFLFEQIKVNSNYAKSDLLQILCVLKNYGMLKVPQLNQFEK